VIGDEGDDRTARARDDVDDGEEAACGTEGRDRVFGRGLSKT
jgi:hypothetical protein